MKSSRNKEENIKKTVELKRNVSLMLQRTITFQQKGEWELEITGKHTLCMRFIW